MKLLSLLCLSLLFTFTACTKGGNEIKKISAQETMGLVANDFATLVDVREEGEVKEGMAAPARWIATSKIEADSPEWKSFVEALPKNKEVVLYCKAGVRAQKAADKLKAQGFKVSYFSGFDEWKSAGLPVKKP